MKPSGFGLRRETLSYLFGGDGMWWGGASGVELCLEAAPGPRRQGSPGCELRTPAPGLGARAAASTRACHGGGGPRAARPPWASGESSVLEALLLSKWEGIQRWGRVQCCYLAGPRAFQDSLLTLTVCYDPANREV